MILTPLLIEFNVTLLVLTTITYLITIYFFRHYTRKDNRNWGFIFAEIGIAIFIGSWVSLVAAICILSMFLRILAYLMYRDELLRPLERRALKMGQKIRASISRFFLGIMLAMIGVFYGIVIAGRIAGLDIMNIIAFSFGVIVVGAWSKKFGIPFYNKNPKWNFKSFKAIALIAMIGGISTVSIIMSPSNHPPLEGSIEIKTMSFNILYAGEDGTLKDWPDRREPLSDYIETLDLDVFGLQEVFEIQGDYLNNTLTNRNYTWVGIGRETPYNGYTGEHDAIFYDTDRFNLVDNGTLWFSDTPTVSSRTWLTETIKRTYQWVHLQDKTTGAEFFLYNTHYGFYPEFHMRASMQLNNDIKSRTGDLPVLVTGDFNMPVIFPFYSFLEGFGTKPLYNAFRLKQGYVSPSEIDFVFVTPDIHVNMIKEDVDANKGAQWLSDHDPVLMNCQIPI